MPETATQYKAKIIGEFRADQGRVGGTWEEIPLLSHTPQMPLLIDIFEALQQPIRGGSATASAP